MCNVYSIKHYYRLTAKQKASIAQNLIEILENGSKITEQTVTFIGNWVLTGPNEKTKMYYDIWDYVLKNYMPTIRPILFRSCNRRNNGKIASFTGLLESARRFSKRNDFLLICDTKEYLEYYEVCAKRGTYRHTFYPLSTIFRREKELKSDVFSETLLEQGIDEDEYIMRIDLDSMCTLKWYDNLKLPETYFKGKTI